MSFFIGKHPPKVLKATWYLNENNLFISNKGKSKAYIPSGKYVLGVLYSDNVIRFFI